MKKKSHGVQLLIRAVVRDPDGKVISDTGQKPAGSFVIQFLQFIGAMARGITTNAKKTNGASDVIFASTSNSLCLFTVYAPINIDTYGIHLGTGDTPEANDDYKLDTQLTEGLGAGNITHGATVVGTAGIVGANVDLEITRAFTNNTGSLITAKEAGVVVRTLINGGTPVRPFLIIRDVLTAPTGIPDKCSLTIYYTIRTTV